MLADMPDGCKAFIDSNIFIYHFLDLSEVCTAFLERVKAREIRGFTSEVVLMEVLHKLMIAEIASNYGISRLDVNRLIKRQPSVISELKRCETAVQEISEFDIEVFPMMSGAVIESRTLRSEYQLMTRDSINLFLMRLSGLKDIATNDSDFYRVPWIRVWKP
jgi:predicted nucleic acid-binding protein